MLKLSEAMATGFETTLPLKAGFYTVIAESDGPDQICACPIAAACIAAVPPTNIYDPIFLTFDQWERHATILFPQLNEDVVWEDVDGGQHSTTLYSMILSMTDNETRPRSEILEQVQLLGY
jgi:hypothetical protein